jgi:dephospho-CoA kinase
MLIAVAGLAGAGKTTAVKHLDAQGLGQIKYVGDYIRKEVINRGLPLTPESEQKVRQALRDEHGLDVFAQMAIDDIGSSVQSTAILIDAICVGEEAELYRRHFGSDLIVLGIKARFEIRASRLVARCVRPMTAGQLRERDQFELNSLLLGEVLTAADYQLSNEDTIAAFKDALDALAAQW